MSEEKFLQIKFEDNLIDEHNKTTWIDKEVKKFYENKESNEDSKSDARVALVLVICFVAAALFWVSGQ